MYSKQFYFRIVIRIVLILGVCLAISFVYTFRERWFTILGLLLLLSLQVAELIRYVFKVGNSISDFIVSLKYNDITLPNTGKQNNLINIKFIKNLKELQQKVSYIRAEQIIQAHFIENLLEQIEIGIIAILPNGKLKFKNDAVMRLLNLKSFGSLDFLKVNRPDFYHSLISIKPGEDRLLTLIANNELKKISIKSTQFKSNEEVVKLVFFQNIKNEIDESLLQSWQNLIRILTHEINNTVSPIASLADSLSIYLSKDGNKLEPIEITSIEQRSINNSFEGLTIIKDRSNGLLDFVNKYRSLLPKKNLSITKIEVSQLFYRLKILFSEKFLCKKILMVATISPDGITINADQQYFEQVMINLISNSIDAFENFKTDQEPTIELKSSKGERGETMVQVIDNGKGIASENLDKVFIPFYSTKDSGTGIGLSLSMQIIRLHGGSISVSSIEGEKTVFSIRI